MCIVTFQLFIAVSSCAEQLVCFGVVAVQLAAVARQLVVGVLVI